MKSIPAFLALVLAIGLSAAAPRPVAAQEGPTPRLYLRVDQSFDSKLDKIKVGNAEPVSINRGMVRLAFPKTESVDVLFYFSDNPAPHRLRFYPSRFVDQLDAGSTLRINGVSLPGLSLQVGRFGSSCSLSELRWIGERPDVLDPERALTHLFSAERYSRRVRRIPGADTFGCDVGDVTISECLQRDLLRETLAHRETPAYFEPDPLGQGRCGE